MCRNSRGRGSRSTHGGGVCVWGRTTQKNMPSAKRMAPPFHTGPGTRAQPIHAIADRVCTTQGPVLYKQGSHHPGAPRVPATQSQLQQISAVVPLPSPIFCFLWAIVLREDQSNRGPWHRLGQGGQDPYCHPSPCATSNASCHACAHTTGRPVRAQQPTGERACIDPQWMVPG